MDQWMNLTVLTTTEAADMISELLMEEGSQGTMIEDKADFAANQRPEGRWDILDEAIAARMSDDVKVTGYYPMDENFDAVLANVRACVTALGDMELGMDLGKLEVIAEPFENKDWAESWKEAYHPFRLGTHFVVKPGWTEYDAQPGDKIIEIDPGMAFGTGTHETTGMCTELVEKYVKPGQTVIDIGTGSGILAIAAAHMGAKPVLATDLDELAVKVAIENVEINGFADTITVRCGDLLDVVDISGDVVIANIIADVNIMLARPVRERIKKGGMFICSGIAIDRREDVRAALLDAGYTIIEEPVKGEWAAFASRMD